MANIRDILIVMLTPEKSTTSKGCLAPSIFFAAIYSWRSATLSVRKKLS
jgi:hypothetical protein